MGGRLEDDAVGVGSGGDGGDGGEGGAVKDDDGVAAAIGDVAELAGGIEGDAVRAMEVADGAEGLPVCVSRTSTWSPWVM